MTFQEFLEKYNGEFVEVAGSPGAINQCVDLANAYIRDVLGQPIIEWTNAIDFPSKAGDKYDYFLNTPTGIPKEGDLIIFHGTNGHISIFIEGNVDTFRSLDQNYPTGSNVHVQNHNYNNPPVLGWLRFKGPIPNLSLEECKRQVEEEITKKNETWQELQEVKSELEGFKFQIISYENFQKQIAITLNVEPDQAKILGEIVKYVEIEDQLRQTQKKIEELQQSIIQANNLYDELDERYKASEKEKQDVLGALQQVTEREKGLKELYKKLEKSYEDLKKYNKFIYKHLIFGLYTREKR